MLSLYPLSVACIERVFMKMKLIKTCLPNHLAQVQFDQLSRIASESSKEGYHDRIYKNFVEALKGANLKMRIEIYKDLLIKHRKSFYI